MSLRNLWRPRYPVSLIKPLERGGPVFILRAGKRGRIEIVKNWGNR